MKQIYIVIITTIILTIITKLLGASILVSLFLGISIFLLYFLSKLKNKKLGIFGGIIILSLDIILFLLTLIPTQSYNLKVNEFYKNKDNYLKIFIKDNERKLRSMFIKIENKGKTRKKIYLSKYKKGQKIKVIEGDKIYFIGRKTNKSFAVIYLWDNSILRLKPQSRIKLTEIKKNLNNLTDSETKIDIENGTLWFKVIKLIKGSNGMQIRTGKGQALIIRGTAGLVEKNKQGTYIIDYKHFIELRVGNKSKILNEKQGAKIKENKINIVTNLKSLLKEINLDKNILKEFDILDKKDVEKFNKEIKEYLIKNIGKQQVKIIESIEKIKLKIFSIGDKKYKEYLENLETYEYLIGKSNKITDKLINDPNFAFIAGSLGDFKVRTEYLYNQLKKNMKNSDLYKTYIINKGIDKKVSNMGKELKSYINNIKDDINSIQNELNLDKQDFNIDF